VKTSIRVLAQAFLAACFLGLAGCGADNDTEAARLNAAQGQPPPPANKGGETPPPVSNIQDYAKRRQGEMQNEGVRGSYAKGQGVKAKQ
jgi:hypothetical protein